MKKIFTWKKYHRWIGLVMSVFMLVFCVSGIILNHRSLFCSIDVGRWWMPASYHIKNFNNGVVKGTLAVGSDSVLVYGNAGVWLTDHDAKYWSEYNNGLPTGADNRNIKNIVRTKTGAVWMASQYEVYRLLGNKWIKETLTDIDTRIADVALTKDSSDVVVLSRDAAYLLSDGAKRIILKTPEGYKPQTTLFRTIWKLHSGELFGIVGRLVVDAIAVVLIILSITGIILFVLPYGIRSKKRSGNKDAMKSLGKKMVWHQRWHNKFGYATIILTLWIAITGMCLRPPLMIPFVMAKTLQSIKDGNAWHDKLRAIRWSKADGCWIVSTSEGFMKVDEHFKQAPQLVAKDKAPNVSPMGITVFEPTADGEWIVGSFSGLYRWNMKQGMVKDYFTVKPTEQRSMRPVSNVLTSGYSIDFFDCKPVVFDYAKGASAKLTMPEELSESKMSLWNVALELHVGRCYTPFLGPLSDLFVFLSGLLISLTLISGYVILHRQKKKRRNKNNNKY